MSHPRICRAWLGAVAVTLAALAPASLSAQKQGEPPYNVRVTGTAGLATVSWNPVKGKATYRVLRALDVKQPGEDLAGALDAVSFDDPKVAPSTTYFYQVIAMYSDGRVGTAAPVQFTVPTATTTVSPQRLVPISGGITGKVMPVQPPGGITIQATPTSVTIGWAPVVGATSYTVERATNGAGPWALLPWAPQAGTQITAASPVGPAGGMLYFYRISAIRGAGAVGSTMVPYFTPPLRAPTVVAWRQDHADLVISWSPAPGATKYVVTAVSTRVPAGGTAVNRYIEVDPQYTSVRLPSPSAAGNVGAVLAVKVNARFEPGSILTTQAQVPAIDLAPANSCWPQAATATGGPGPAISNIIQGVTTLGATLPMTMTSAYLIERAVTGTGAWEPIRCEPPDPNGRRPRLADESLQPGTQYDYRISSVSPSAVVSRSTVTLSTLPQPDNPPLSVSVSGNSTNLSWPAVPGADAYRITSSYGYYMERSASYATGVWIVVPSGTHIFALAVLYPTKQAGMKPPSQVTVVVP